MHVAGIDCGSVAVKLVVVDDHGQTVHSVYARHKGRPLACAVAMLGPAVYAHPGLHLALTGTGAERMARAAGAKRINELTALAEACAACLPSVRTVFEMGGEDVKFLRLDEAGGIADFALNSACAAGTGSFLDQQAERMGMDIDEFAERAAAAKRPARIAGRCSVFAKSDMIHLQQIGTGVDEIAAGLCMAVARNVQAAIVRGREVAEPAVFLGGVAKNAGVARAMAEVFGLPGLILPPGRAHFGALGAALRARREGSAVAVNIDALRGAAESGRKPGASLPPLFVPGAGMEDRHRHAGPGALRAKPESTAAYMGIDVGSISTNLVLMDDAGHLIAKRYLRTASRPIEAVRRGLAEIRDELAERGLLEYVAIRGAGVTGSGRYMIADFVRADVVKNEITAQARAALEIDPEVDTIFEIGGQDSKFISIADGVIADFEMNKACAAGTGSFLEEQAERLGVAIKGEFQDLAFGAGAPCALGERCTVFMENSLRHGLAKGAGKDEVLAGLAYSIVQNYINRVVAGRPIGQRIFFQGGTAFNKAVAAAFERHLGREIIVPPHHDVTGAIGMAIIAREHMDRADTPKTAFRGFALADVDYEITSFTCSSCENRCEINQVAVEGRKLAYGGRCEKYDQLAQAKALARKDGADEGGEDHENLFAFRTAEMMRAHKRFAERSATTPRGQIGLPLALFLQDRLPWWSAFLHTLGFRVTLSGPTTPALAELGVSASRADTCHPVKVALGHVAHLLETLSPKVAQVIPSFVNMAHKGEPAQLACPLTQSFPYQARAAFPEADIIAPEIDRHHGDDYFLERLLTAFKRFGVRKKEIKEAVRLSDRAMAEYQAALWQRGAAFLEHVETAKEPALVIAGRGYNALDKGMNLNLPAKLAVLGVRAIPADMLKLPPDRDADLDAMYWRTGRRLMRVARLVRQIPELFLVHVGSFSCGPDSFIEKLVDRELCGKPCLRLELDEHTADAGIMTRVEAFLDSIRPAEAPEPPALLLRPRGGFKSRVVYGPHMSDHALGVAAAFRSQGIRAEILPETDDHALALGRAFTSGKECHPCAVTVGDLVAKVTSADFDPDASAFFLPGGSGPCRYGQYSAFHRLTLDALGCGQVPIFSPMQDTTFFDDMAMASGEFARRGWEAVVAFDLLAKCLHQTRPFEKLAGEADALYASARDEIIRWTATRGKDLLPLLKRIRGAFEAIDVYSRKEVRKPRIGVVGEIFVRSNRFSNEDLVRRIEALGGEVTLAGWDEWFHYVAHIARREARLGRQIRQSIKLKVQDKIQRRVQARFERAFEWFLHDLGEPGASELLALAEPILPGHVRGEAVLTVGKSRALAKGRHPVHGIVSAIPFGCMPGALSASLLGGGTDSLGVPLITLAFDGTPQPGTALTLEAFVQQARDRMASS